MALSYVRICVAHLARQTSVGQLAASHAFIRFSLLPPQILTQPDNVFFVEMRVFSFIKRLPLVQPEYHCVILCKTLVQFQVYV